MAQKDLERSVKNNNRGIWIAFIIIVAFNTLWTVWRDSNLATVKAIDIEGVALVSSNELCPGEKLIFRYHIKSRGAGQLVRDTTVWDVNPPRTLIYSNSRRFILPGKIEQDLREAWKVPHRYFNHETAEWEPIPAGQYERLMSISSLNNPEATDTISVQFTIREDCHVSNSSQVPD